MSGDHPLRLLPGEKLVSSIPAPIHPPPALPDARQELARLTGAALVEDIGVFGPPISSLTPRSGGSADYLRLFEAVFGRDSLVMAVGLASLYPRLIQTTVRYLAERQGVAREVAPEPDLYEARGEAPGRIPHEIRDEDDETARSLARDNSWGWPYYAGQVDANDLFVLAATKAAESDPRFLDQTFLARDGRSHTIAEAVCSAFEWSSGQTVLVSGLFACSRVGNPADRIPHAYPTWQDSGDSTMRADGSLTVGRVALAELQANRFDALCAMADLAEGRPGLRDMIGRSTDDPRQQAERLRDAVLRGFWSEGSGGNGRVAYGLEEREDGAWIALNVNKSNTGHLLNSRILEGAKNRDRVSDIVVQLLHRDRGLVCPAGLRTLADGERLFRPGAYHNGTVWPWDTIWIAQGLQRHGFHRCAVWLCDAILRACRELRYFPEHIRGEDSAHPTVNDHITTVECHDPWFRSWTNRLEQPPQVIQGWTVTAYILAERLRNSDPQLNANPDGEVGMLDRELVERLPRMK